MDDSVPAPGEGARTWPFKEAAGGGRHLEGGRRQGRVAPLAQQERPPAQEAPHRLRDAGAPPQCRRKQLPLHLQGTGRAAPPVTFTPEELRGRCLPDCCTLQWPKML